ncbi:MAG: ABC transporter permease [Candidatus Thorarchaeota archaeon]
MSGEFSTKDTQLRNFGLITLLAIVAAVWGYLFPGRLSESVVIQLPNVSLSPSLVLIVMVLLSLLFLLLGELKDWELHIGSGITVRSREISVLGSILLLITSFSFTGFDVLFFFIYYYELLIVSIYTLISITLIPVLLLGLITVIILLSGLFMRYRTSELRIARWTLRQNQSSDILITGIVFLLLTAFVFSLYQPNYVSVERDGILETILDLPLGSSATTVLAGFYLNLEIYTYPLVIFICGLLLLRMSLKKPYSPILDPTFTERMGEYFLRFKRGSWRLFYLVLLLMALLFLVMGIEWLVALDTGLESIYSLQIDLFKIGAQVVVIFLIFLLLLNVPRALKPFLDDRVVKYTIRRLFSLIPIFIGVSIISYALMITTGNPIDLIVQTSRPGTNRTLLREQLTRLYGLDAPPQAQWFNWFLHFAMGDMGISILGGGRVADLLSSRVGPTLLITVIPLILTLLISVPLGIYAALKQYSTTDNAIALFVAVGLSIPIFLFILFLIVFFSYYIPIFPSAGLSLSWDVAQGATSMYIRLYLDTFLRQLFTWEFWDLAFHLVIPITAITLISLALFVRLVRSGLLEVIRQDYILSAQAYGFSRRSIIWRHALRNVMIPLVTYIGLSIGGLLGGAPLTETTLAWPGLGSYAVQQFNNFNYTTVMGIIMVTALLILIANLLTDILYSIIDPRVSL